MVFPVAKVVKGRFIFTSWVQLLLDKSLNCAATFESGFFFSLYYFNFFFFNVHQILEQVLI